MRTLSSSGRGSIRRTPRDGAAGRQTGGVRTAAVTASVAVMLVVAAGVVVVASGGFAAVRRAFVVESHYARRVAQFEARPVSAGDVVFVGDSLTEFGEWSQRFPGVSVRNHGIAGDDSAGVLARLEDVTAGRPAKIFLMIGTNDLTDGADEEAVVANVEEIVTRIAAASPDTQTFVQSILPRARRDRARVESLNRRLRAAVAGEAVWIDLYPHFVDDRGSIRDTYSDDDLHLRGEGYAVWRDVIAPHVLGGTES